MNAHNGGAETHGQESAVVDVGQVRYQKLHRVVYDDYLRRRYPVEIWVSVPEHGEA